MVCWVGKLHGGSGVMGVLALQAGDSNIPSEVLYLLKSVRYHCVCIPYVCVINDTFVHFLNVHVCLCPEFLVILRSHFSWSSVNMSRRSLFPLAPFCSARDRLTTVSTWLEMDFLESTSLNGFANIHVEDTPFHFTSHILTPYYPTMLVYTANPDALGQKNVS